MKQILTLFLSVIIILISFSCKKTNVPKETPSCIKQQIRNILKEDVRNPPAEVWKYEYNGKTVYYIPAFCCDAMSVLFDEDCNVICNPDGGLTGNGDGKCTDFSQKSSKGELIWKDKR